MRVAILGAGAMGSWFGGRLAQAGADVQLLTPNDAYREAVNSQGLALQSDTDTSTVTLPAYKPADIQAPVDLIILMTKSFQSRDAMASISHVLTENTFVLSLQNGLGTADMLSEFLPVARIMVGVTMMPVDKIAPGVVRKTGDGPTWFYSVQDVDLEIHHQILEAFSKTNLHIELDKNIHKRIWEKVAFNAGMNALCALAHGTPGNIGASTEAMELVKAVAREVSVVGESNGVNISLESVFATIEFACSQHKDHKPSMLQDLLSGHRTEVEALNGAVVKYAHKTNTDAPLNKTLATLVSLAENSQSKRRG